MIKKRFNYYAIVLLLLSSFTMFAQDDDGPEPPPEASIEDYLLPMFLAGIMLGAYMLYNRKKHVKKV